MTLRKLLPPPIVFEYQLSYFYEIVFFNLTKNSNTKPTIIMTKVNKFYEAPSTTVVELKTQGIICVSGNINATMSGTFSEEDILLP